MDRVENNVIGVSSELDACNVERIIISSGRYLSMEEETQWSHAPRQVFELFDVQIDPGPIFWTLRDIR